MSSPSHTSAARGRSPPSVPITVFYQDQVARRARESVRQLGEADGHLLQRRPFLATWFSNQVAICLGLWEYNHTLVHALELAKAFLVPLDVLNALWPCPGEPRLVLLDLPGRVFN